MVKRMMWLISLTVIVSMALVACGPTPAAPTEAPPPTEAPTKAPEPTQAPEVVKTGVPGAEKGVVMFVVWAEDDFGIQTLKELAKTFNETYGIEVDLVFLNE